MKDLIKKKTQSTGGWKDDVIYCYPANNNIEHNIITAPKSIKLSEVLDKICELYEEKFDKEIYFNRKINRIGYGEYDEDWMQNTWYTIVAFNKDLSIRGINNVDTFDSLKWLYTLWIAGTEIIDDLEDKE